MSPLVFATPDLQVMDLQYKNSRLVANIFNQAPDGLTDPITVKFYDNGDEIGSTTYTTPLSRYSIFSTYIDYLPSVGSHEFTAVVDPDNIIIERKDTNNDKTTSYERIEDLQPRSAVPDIEQPKPQEVPEDKNTVFVYLAAVMILTAILASRLLKGRTGFLHRRAGKEKPKKAAQKKEKAHTTDVASSIRLNPCSIVRLRAALLFSKNIGDDYTYFVKDKSAEAVGVCDKKYTDGEYELECMVESFMKTDRILRIRDARP